MKLRIVPSRLLSLSVLIGALTTAGCATPVPPPAPEWIRGSIDSPPAERRFVAYGRGADESEAESRAHSDAQQRVAAMLADAVVEELGGVSDEAAEIIERVAAERVADLPVVDRYSRVEPAGDTETYRLYAYASETYAADRRAVIDAVQVAPASPSATAPATGGRALERFRESVRAEVPDDDAARSDSVAAILSASTRLTMAIEPAERTVPLAREDSISFTVQFQGPDGDGITNVEMTARVRAPEIDGERRVESYATRTRGDGTAAITVPPPELAGRTVVEVEPSWLADAVAPWYESIDDPERLDMLDAAVERVRARAVIQAESRAGSIPTGLVMIDRDIAGNPIERADSLRGWRQELEGAGFQLRPVQLDPGTRSRLARAQRLTVSQLYDVLPFEVLASVDRVIIGEAQITDFTESDGFTVTVLMEAAAFDLRGDRVLARLGFEERISSSDAQSSIRAAFQAAGRRLARRLIPRLP